jgi:peptide/nickel transport system substrate-binding protein
VPRPPASRATAIIVCVLLLFGCAGPSPTPSPLQPTGGTLRVAIVQNGSEALAGSPYYDPAAVFSFSPLNRCCLVRMLLSYNGRPIEEGGVELQPDLAQELPRVSRDGLEWTFTLKAGLPYAPPLEDRTIEARDFITAAEHAIRVGDNPFLDDIVGVREFREGLVDTISGIVSPDARTVVFRLTAPAGDLGNRLAMGFMAPLPAEALADRDDAAYAGFLVASGPYMYEGADHLSLEAHAQPIWADREAGRVTLVRNPSWSRESDPLRPAHADSIEAIMVADASAGIALIESGDADLLGEPTPATVAKRYLASDTLRTRVFSQPAIRLHYMSMNLAVPPFDDVHVRRATNLVIDRAAAAVAIGKLVEASAVVAHHAFPDSVENGLLRTYDPYPSTGDGGDIGGARDEMRQSVYDRDRDGRCDASVCAAVPAATLADNPELASLIADDLSEIGIELVGVPQDDVFRPDSRIAIFIGIGWGADYPSGSNFTGLVSKDGIFPEQNLNFSLVGASPDQLMSWGYHVTQVPDLEGKVESCRQAVGSAAFMCWAELDQLIVERVVAWVPVAFIDQHWAFSERVAEFSPDVESVGPALDQIRLHPDS